MTKHKSHKGLLKRVRITGRGKVKFKRANSGHLRSVKNGKKLRHLRKPRVAKSGDIVRFQKMLHIRLLGSDKCEPAEKAKCCDTADGCDGQQKKAG